MRFDATLTRFIPLTLRIGSVVDELTRAQKAKLMMEREDIIRRIGNAMLLPYGFDKSVLNDLVQETYLRTLPKLDSIRSVEKVPAYTDKVARSVCREWLRKRKDETSMEDAPEPSDLKPLPDDLLIKKERRELAMAAAEFLKPNPREAVLGRLNNESDAEIAKRLKVKTQTVRSYIHRSTPDIQERIEKYGTALISMASEERVKRLRREGGDAKKGSKS